MRTLLAALAAVLCCPASARWVHGERAAPGIPESWTARNGRRPRRQRRRRLARIVGARGRPRAVRVALAAGTLAGGWEGTTLLGAPARAADGLAVLASPAVALRHARQRVRAIDPVVVTARCSAACDLSAGRDSGSGGPARMGVAQLDRPGDVRLELHPLLARLAPPRARLLRVTVHATAPGGRRETVARIDVRVRGEKD